MKLKQRSVIFRWFTREKGMNYIFSKKRILQRVALEKTPAQAIGHKKFLRGRKNPPPFHPLPSLF